MSRSRLLGTSAPSSPDASRRGSEPRNPSPLAGEGGARRNPKSDRMPDFKARGCSEGFTLIELIVIMTIIAILTALSVPMGMSWIGGHRFTAMVRAFPNAVLMARMRGIENRQVIAITGSVDYTTQAPFTACCPGILFTTNIDHGLSGPKPTLANNLVCSTTVGCPGVACAPIPSSSCRKQLVSTTTTAGDSIMISGLDRHRSMNGVEFEVLKVTDNTHFAVLHAYNGALGDIAGADTTGTVRQLTAPGRLRIVPAAAVTTATTLDNEENFQSSDFTVKEEGSSIVFRYNAAKFQATVNGQLLDTATPPTSVQIPFDSRGFPSGNSTQSVWLQEVVPTSVKRQGRQVAYRISVSGKVDTQASY